ncbi:MAG: hypothetical protein WA124_08835 [Smithella sp.]
MAESPAHRFGQIIGELLEAVVLPQLVLDFNINRVISKERSD